MNLPISISIESSKVKVVSKGIKVEALGMNAKRILEEILKKKERKRSDNCQKLPPRERIYFIKRIANCCICFRVHGAFLAVTAKTLKKKKITH